MLKRWGVRTMHFVSPSVWAWRAERLRTIGRAVDRMLVLFPFEPPLYEQAGIPVTYVGHPMAAEMAHAGTRRAARELLKIRGAAPVFALLPGSRLSEIELHAPLVLDAAAHITASRPDAQFLVPLVSRATREAFEMAIYRGSHSGLPLTLLYGHATDALRAADVARVASGTATLEAALARCPHVIFYRVSSLTARIVARKLLLPYVGLPNVLAGRFVVPELLQTDATPRNLAQAALNLFDDSLVRRRLETLFGQMGDALRADTGQVAAEALVTELAHVGIAC
jgi:lipid-A-disaccharide synthase